MTAARLHTWLRRWLRQTHGQDLIEYAMPAAFISLAAYGAAGQLGGSLDGWYSAFSRDVAEKEKKSNCSPSGMAHSQGKCHGG
jgi:Flp pilus assembly pilin Flp